MIRDTKLATVAGRIQNPKCGQAFLSSLQVFKFLSSLQGFQVQELGWLQILKLPLSGRGALSDRRMLERLLDGLLLIAGDGELRRGNLSGLLQGLLAPRPKKKHTDGLSVVSAPPGSTKTGPQAHTRTPLPPAALTHAGTRTFRLPCTHARTHARTRTHTHTQTHPRTHAHTGGWRSLHTKGFRFPCTLHTNLHIFAQICG